MTDVVIYGNKLLPGAGDWYLSKTGYESQMTDEPADPHQPDNLEQPVPGNQGAHGVFDDRSTDSSWQFWLSRNRNGLAAASVLGVAYLALTSRSH